MHNNKLCNLKSKLRCQNMGIPQYYGEGGGSRCLCSPSRYSTYCQVSFFFFSLCPVWWRGRLALALFPLGGVGYPQPVMEQSVYPSHTGLVTQPWDLLLLCATAEGFQSNFRDFIHYQHLLNPLVWIEVGANLKPVLGSDTQPPQTVSFK